MEFGHLKDLREDDGNEHVSCLEKHEAIIIFRHLQVMIQVLPKLFFPLPWDFDLFHFLEVPYAFCTDAVKNNAHYPALE